jgi:predicted transcriptional regulator
MTTKDGRRAPGSLEAEVMGVLWENRDEMTAAEVQAALGGGLAYNTVQTILIRLYHKGSVQRRKAGRGHTYWPSRDAAVAAAESMRSALRGRADPQEVLQQFAAGLDDSDAATLRQVLDEADKRRRT